MEYALLHNYVIGIEKYCLFTFFGANAESSDLVELIPSSYQNASSSKQGILSSLFYFKHQLNMVNSNT